MILQEPGETGYDLEFKLLGFSVRTHPLFFVLPILLGSGFVKSFSDVNPGIGMLIVVAVFWISVLIHELGHSLAFRQFGVHSRIVLYWLGGLAIPERWGGTRGKNPGSLTPVQRMIVSFAGPLAGLITAAVLCLLVISLKGEFGWIWGFIPVPSFANSPIPNAGAIHLAFLTGIVLNIFLNLLNLVPIFPLDGGQIVRQWFILSNPWNGLKQSLIISMVACAAMILLSLQMQSFFIAVMFGFIAYSNFMELQGPRW